jgi:hypothetical protein
MASILIDAESPIDAGVLFAAVTRHCPGAELITAVFAAAIPRGVDGVPEPLALRRFVPLLRVPLRGGRWLQGEVHGRAVALACPPPVTEADVAPLHAALREVPGLRVQVIGVGTSHDEPGPPLDRGCM